MTRFLASISNIQEAKAILATGVDILDIKDPGKGALGAVEPQIVRQIVDTISGRVVTSATIGDLPMQDNQISEAINSMRSTAVDIIKVGVFAEVISESVLQVIKKFTEKGSQIVLVYFADLKPCLHDFSSLVDAGIYGVMLDTADKQKGSLRTILNDHELGDFVRRARSCGLMTGLAGSLGIEDILPLLSLVPDYLGFRGALCHKKQRMNRIDIQASGRIRAMIPPIQSKNFNTDKLAVTM